VLDNRPLPAVGKCRPAPNVVAAAARLVKVNAIVHAHAGKETRPPPSEEPALHLAFVALGANLAEPMLQVQAAGAALAAQPDFRLLRLSSLYRTAPLGIHAQPDFINAVAAIETSLQPAHLLEALFAIERQFGRQRNFRNSPRTLDLDLLLYDDLMLAEDHLCLPHPRMHLRAFVIAPLVEIAPDCRIPGRGYASAWLPALSQQRIEKLAR